MLKKYQAQEITISLQDVQIKGLLNIPDDARGLVLFAHGSGSSRFSPRNVFVAEALAEADIATLLLDLLTPIEEENRNNVFDLDLLAQRLQATVSWLQVNKSTHQLPLGFFGASTGAGAALQAAASNNVIKAIVSRGGRPDLALSFLSNVLAPTLLIVGGLDVDVLELNKLAFLQLSGTKELKVIPGATHLFEEAGALEQVVKLAVNWFAKFLI